MIERIIDWSARNGFLIGLATFFLMGWGMWAVSHTPLDALPDLSDVQVIVFTDWPGRSPDLVEDQITYPIVTSMLGAPRIKYVRGQSFLGPSFVYIVFEDGTDMYWARSRVVEYMQGVAGTLPEGVTPTLGPDATGVGWIFQYALVDESGTHDLAELRSFQDWYLRYWLQSVPGVAEVASIGGFVKQYQVQVDPIKLQGYGVSLHKVIEAIRRSNNDVGGRVIEASEREYMVRGRGYIQSLDDIRVVPLGTDRNGTPITVEDVANVAIGPDMRRGVGELDGKGEAVGGIVVMRYGENALAVIDRVKAKLREIEASVPEGIRIVPVYDRSDLILRAIATLKEKLIEVSLVVIVVTLVFLFHIRSALVAILVLPVAILLSFVAMYYLGITSNVMSLAGIAIAIGAMVDAIVVMVENAHRRLEEWQRTGGKESRVSVIVRAAQEVGKPLFFSLLIITVSFLPVFMLEAQEGRLFRPLAATKTFSMFFASLVSMTLGPLLMVLFIRGRIHAEERNPLNWLLVRVYRPVARGALRVRWLVLALAAGGFLWIIPLFSQLGSEFMPPLNEGTILYMPTALPGISIKKASEVLQTQDRLLKEFPEVDRVFGKMGRASTPTDPAPLSMAETVVTLKPQDQWRPGMTWDKLVKELDQTLQIPGMPNVWWIPIQTRTEMLSTGFRSKLGIKVFGDDLEGVEASGIRIEQALQNDERTAPYTRSAFAERISGGYFLDFDIDRKKIARYGLTVADVEDVIMAAVGGMTVSETVEGRERYAINLRYARDFRDDPQALKRVLVPTSTGAQIPLVQLAELNFRTGPPMLRNENGQLVGYVFVDVNDKIGIADYVAAAKQVVAEQADVPAGYRLDWAGQFKYFERAKAKLKVVVPLTLFIVFFMLFINRKSVVESLIILLAMPFSLIGAVWLLAWLDYNLSVAVWVGMIALAGLDAEMGVLMMLYLGMAYRQRQSEGRLQTHQDLVAVITEGAGRRIRPMLMTGMALLLGLIPILWSDGIGADVMKRIAAPMVGGIATALVTVLVLFPAIFAIWKGRHLHVTREGKPMT